MNGKDLIRVGLITKIRGLRGELSVMPLTDDPERFRRLNCVYIEKPAASNRNAASKPQQDFGVIRNEKHSCGINHDENIQCGAEHSERIEYVRFQRGQVIVKFEGCDDSDAAQAFRGSYISITANQLAPLNEGSFYIFDLLGCTVCGMDGGTVGVLKDVLETGSNDVYVIQPGGNNIKRTEEILVPALKSVVKDVDIANKRIVIDYEQPVG